MTSLRPSNKDSELAKLVMRVLRLLPNYDHQRSPLCDPDAELRHLVAELCERLERSEELRRYTTLDDRLDQMLGVVTSMAAFDFSTKVDVFEGDDWSMNALAIGLNMLGEELENSTRQLTRTRNHALAANQAKSSFLANMSHELRTPLNAIIGYSELIREELPEGVPVETAQDLEYVLVAARHLLNLINDTLDLAKIESGKMKLRPVHVDLWTMLTDITGTLVPMAKARDTTLSWSIDPGLSGVLTDAIKLQQVLYNLVSNALKFTHNGSVNIEVDVEQCSGRDWILIHVCDSGIGIPADKIEVIFKAFRQVEEGSTRTFEGSGLGLAISRHYCTMMGGGLDVVSEPGQGSTFTIRIPKVLELLPTQNEQAELATRYALILDADPRSRVVVREAAEALGYWASFADTHNIIELSRALRPALVVLDVANVDTDGWKLLASLKSFPELEKTRFCVVSESIDRKRAFALGVMDNLPKPVSRETLRDYLARRDAVASARVVLCFIDRALADTVKRQFEGAGLMTELVTRGALTSDVGLAGASALVIEAGEQYPVETVLEVVKNLRHRPTFVRLPIAVVVSSRVDEAPYSGDPDTFFCTPTATELVELTRTLFGRVEGHQP